MTYAIYAIPFVLVAVFLYATRPPLVSTRRRHPR